MRVLFCSFLMLAAGLLCTGVSHANQCKFSAERNLDIDPAGLHALALKLGSSDAHVRGVAGLAKIEVRGKACASEGARLAGLTIEQARNGDTVTVTPHQDGERTISLFGSSYAYIDLDVRLPQTLAITIDTHSGDSDVADVAALDFSSHSGDLLLNRVDGDVAIETGSGDIHTEDVGSLDLRRVGSGDVRAKQVRGEVTVGHVGSGNLTFKNVGKNVRVESVGSGDVEVDDVAGDVAVAAIGSGDVDADGVGGAFTVKSAGSSDITYHNVKGRVDVPRRDDD
jgi:hypothetical protein